MFKLLNKCFNGGNVPSSWLKEIITPVPKGGGDPRDPLSYRGTTLTTCIYKIYCSILNNRKNVWAEMNGLIADEQNGFRNMTGNILNAIGLRQLYSHVECAVRVNGHVTPWFKVDSGVKQGCVLSPLLFNLFGKVA